MARPGMMVGEKEHTIQNDMLQVGDPAPNFLLTANDFSVRTLADYEGKVKVISVIPSIDTHVCAAQTHRFNEEAANFNNTAVLTVSADTPFALGKFCGNEGIDNTETLSTYRDMKFADDYGVHDVDWRVCQRAVFVIDQDNVIQYAEYVNQIGHNVNFLSVLAKVQELS